MAAIAATSIRVASLGHGGDRGNQHTGGKSPIGDLPQADAAKRFNVGKRTVKRAMVAARVADMPQGRPSEKSPIGEITQSDAAKRFNVGKRTVERARAVLDGGAPALVAIGGRRISSRQLATWSRRTRRSAARDDGDEGGDAEAWPAGRPGRCIN
jgi:hypothetical protein